MLFDTYVMVDWSAAAVPKTGKDSIWLACLSREAPSAPENPRTRAAATERVQPLLREQAHRGRRVLVGFDFPYGYPRGFADVVAPGDGAGWRRIWSELARLVEDDERNRNNRFAVASILNERSGGSGPFWNCPPSAAGSTLQVRKGRFPCRAGVTELAEYRTVDSLLRATRPSVQSVWKLFTAGSVGSQAITGIPRVDSLRNDPLLRSISQVWPFETGFTANPSGGKSPSVIHAEIWPGVFDLDLSTHPVRDAAQVLSLSRELARLDERGELEALFAPPAGISQADLDAARREEGWILGARGVPARAASVTGLAG